MKAQNKRKSTNTRASPSSDGRGDIYSRAYPVSDGRSYTSTSSLRFATWNVGTMTGRSAELSDILKKRQLDVCCVQETKWKGAKSRLIGNGYKLIYNGTTTGKNGVGIILSENLSHRLINTE